MFCWQLPKDDVKSIKSKGQPKNEESCLGFRVTSIIPLLSVFLLQDNVPLQFKQAPTLPACMHYKNLRESSFWMRPVSLFAQSSPSLNATRMLRALGKQNFIFLEAPQ